MYILFINSIGYILFITELEYKFMYFFLSTQVTSEIYIFVQFNNNSNNKKNYPTHGFNPIHVGWVGLGCVGFFLTHHGGLGEKIPSIRPMHTRVRKSQRERERERLRPL